MLDITLVSTPSDDLRLLLNGLDAELSALYSAEQRHGLALEAIFVPHIRFFIARVNGRSAGCGGVALFDDFAEVKRMYVRPEARGQGVADAIMARLMGETRAAGLSTLRLERGTQSFAALTFYRKSGFRDCPAFEPYVSLPAHQIVASAFLERKVP